MKIQTGDSFGKQFTNRVQYPFCNPLEVVDTSDDVLVDTTSSRLVDRSAVMAVNGMTTGVAMLGAIPTVALGLPLKAISSKRWTAKALCVPALPVGALLGAGSAALHLVTGSVMTVVGVGGVLCGAGFFPIELAQRELQRLADAAQAAPLD